MLWVAQLILISAAVLPQHAHRQHRGECDYLFTSQPPPFRPPHALQPLYIQDELRCFNVPALVTHSCFEEHRAVSNCGICSALCLHFRKPEKGVVDIPCPPQYTPITSPTFKPLMKSSRCLLVISRSFRASVSSFSFMEYSTHPVSSQRVRASPAFFGSCLQLRVVARWGHSL